MYYCQVNGHEGSIDVSHEKKSHNQYPGGAAD